jgi:methylated-DNA-protein-cysteine methyltransferase related protein
MAKSAPAARDFEEAVCEVIRSLPPGAVATYGEIAAEAGFPGAARAVGSLLRRSTGLPWWRVVAAGGRLIPGEEAEQAKRLKAEGVAFTPSGKVAPSALGRTR